LDRITRIWKSWEIPQKPLGVIPWGFEPPPGTSPPWIFFARMSVYENENEVNPSSFLRRFRCLEKPSCSLELH
jgi:hypothetical protein